MTYTNRVKNALQGIVRALHACERNIRRYNRAHQWEKAAQWDRAGDRLLVAYAYAERCQKGHEMPATLREILNSAFLAWEKEGDERP